MEFIGGAARSFPAFLWLERKGSTVNGYVLDGTQRTLIGSVVTTLPADALIGLAVTSHQKGVIAAATFDVVSR